ncbi:MAG: hydantoinase B/oxoprolinase family protein [Candidatus Azotimanducaceae bacterium WSBS_2022_MAG_OTU7]
MNNPLDRLRLQLLWDRLLAIVEEQAQTLIRTAFSTTVREAGDLSTGVFDTNGQMLAQAITGTPWARQRDGRKRRIFFSGSSPSTHLNPVTYW